MAKDKEYSNGCCGQKWHKQGGAQCGGAYFLGMIGAAVYYLQQADTFWIGVLGLLKALVWPAFLSHKILGL